MISKVRATALAASCLIAYGVYGCSSDSGNDNPNNPLSDGGTPVGDSQPEGDANGTGIHIDASHPDTGGGDDDGGGSTVVAWPSDACVTKTKALVAQMSRQQKAGQMVMANNATAAEVTQYAPGGVFVPGGQTPNGADGAKNPIGADEWGNEVDAFFNAAKKAPLGIPILYGQDAVHGFNAAKGAVIMPHNAGLGSSRDAALVQEVTHITALEAMAAGVTWTFAPTVSEAWDYRWGRVYESFSYDPTVTASLMQASVKGLQGPKGLGTGAPGVVACGKHFAGDGQAGPPSAKGGIVDRGDIKVDDQTMQEEGIAPYLPSIDSGLGCIMVSDATWNGKSLTSNKTLITDVLKGQVGFKGMVVTDWNAADTAGGVIATVNAGVDMLMEPADWKGTINAIAATNSDPTKMVSDDRMNDAVTRILNVKCQAGLFEYQRDKTLVANVGSTDHRAVARKAVGKSMVLLQNNNSALPIAKTAKVWLGGSGANSLDNQCGGWTMSWQGAGNATIGTTIQAAINKVKPTVANMADADVAVVVLSEPPYAEMLGDKASIDTLPAADFALLDQAKAAGKKVVAVILSGRPVLITTHMASADAWVAAWLPGTEGDGVADVLFGDVKFTGKLSHHWPKDNTQVTVTPTGYDPLFKVGFGLTD